MSVYDVALELAWERHDEPVDHDEDEAARADAAEAARQEAIDEETRWESE
ncbi:hypothetical protein [Georgenia sp. MJ170]